MPHLWGMADWMGSWAIWSRGSNPDHDSRVEMIWSSSLSYSVILWIYDSIIQVVEMLIKVVSPPFVFLILTHNLMVYAVPLISTWPFTVEKARVANICKNLRPRFGNQIKFVFWQQSITDRKSVSKKVQNLKFISTFPVNSYWNSAFKIRYSCCVEAYENLWKIITIKIT